MQNQAGSLKMVTQPKEHIGKRRLYHILFWICYASFWMIVTYDSRMPLSSTIIINISYAVCNVAASYISLYYLMPVFLYPRRFTWFLLLEFGNMLFFSIPIVLTFYVLLLGNPDAMQQVMQPQQMIPASFGSVSMTVILLSMAKLVQQRLKNEQHTQQLEKEKLLAELNFLKSQINPHFLFNAINNIYFLIKKDPETAASLLLKFSDMLRFQLYETQEDFIPLSKEIDHINNYIEIECVRKSPNIEIQKQIEAGGEAPIAPFLLLPLLENAFKYVSKNERREHFIHIQIQQRANTLSLDLSNSYTAPVGRKPDSSGIGLKNVKRRLELLYPDRHHFELLQTEGIFKTSLMIQLYEA